MELKKKQKKNNQNYLYYKEIQHTTKNAGRDLKRLKEW